MKNILLIILLSLPGFIFAQLVNDFRVNDDTTITTQYNGRIGVDANGNFVVVWMNNITINGSVYCQLYNHNAQKIGNNFLIKSNANHPDIAVRKDGSFAVCWKDTVPKFRLYNSNGIPISLESSMDFAINNGGIPPKISCDTSGNFVLVYQKYYAPINKNIHFQRFDNLGNKIGISTRVNDDTLITCAHSYPDVTVRKDGSFIITWQDQRPPAVQGGEDIYMQIYDKYGNKIGSNVKVNTNVLPFDYQFEPLIASDDAGRFYIVYNQTPDAKSLSGTNSVMCQRYNADGTPNGNIFFAATYSQHCFLEAIDTKSNGDFMVTFWEGSLSYCQRISANGSFIGNYYLISTQYPAIPKIITDIAIYNNRVISIWYDGRFGSYDIFGNIRSYIVPDSITSITPVATETPSSYSLSQNYPNPFNPSTKIRFDVALDSRFRGNDKVGVIGNDKVVLKVYDVMGREVQTLVNESLTPGTYEVTFDGTTSNSGVYFYKLVTDGFSETKKMLMIK